MTNKIKNKELNSKKIIRGLEENKKDIGKYGVKKIGIFGSFAKKQQHKNSDIDLLVTFDKPTFDFYMGLKFMLEKLFKKKVDLVIEEDLRPELSYVKKEVKYAKL